MSRFWYQTSIVFHFKGPCKILLVTHYSSISSGNKPYQSLTSQSCSCSWSWTVQGTWKNKQRVLGPTHENELQILYSPLKPLKHLTKLVPHNDYLHVTNGVKLKQGWPLLACKNIEKMDVFNGLLTLCRFQKCRPICQTRSVLEMVNQKCVWSRCKNHHLEVHELGR